MKRGRKRERKKILQNVHIKEDLYLFKEFTIGIFK